MCSIIFMFSLIGYMKHTNEVNQTLMILSAVCIGITLPFWKPVRVFMEEVINLIDNRTE